MNALHLCFTGRQGGPGLLRKVFAGPLSREGARKLYRSLTQAPCAGANCGGMRRGSGVKALMQGQCEKTTATTKDLGTKKKTETKTDDEEEDRQEDVQTHMCGRCT